MNNYLSFVSLLSGYVPPENHTPFLYEIGQRVRVAKRVTKDGSLFPLSGSIGQVIGRKHVGNNIYRVVLRYNTNIFEFSEEDLDRRFIRKNLDKSV